MNHQAGDGSTAPRHAILSKEGSKTSSAIERARASGNEGGPDAAGACRISEWWRRPCAPPLSMWPGDGMGISWNDETGTGTRVPDGCTVRERLGAAERAALRQRISTAVRERELADAEV